MSLLQTVPEDEAEEGPGVASVYDAALARARQEAAQRLQAGVEPGASPSGAGAGEERGGAGREGPTTIEPSEMTVLPLSVTAQAPGSALLRGVDWRDTIGLVERAAATIKAYERRFVQLDIHTRALIDRAADEQARLQEEVRSLEQRLLESEERAQRAELATRDEAFFRWEAERRLREMEMQLTEAVDHSRQSEDYLRRVHTVLAEL